MKMNIEYLDALKRAYQKEEEQIETLGKMGIIVDDSKIAGNPFRLTEIYVSLAYGYNKVPEPFSSEIYGWLNDKECDSKDLQRNLDEISEAVRSSSGVYFTDFEV